uniref:Pentatricopeptide repeat-containing protein n=1 Tax=Salix viminalis TaxID=40686 RepID=A0A6N2KVY0_SALVM
MPERNTISWNGLVSGYGMISEARKVLDKMPEGIDDYRGCVQEGLIEEAEMLFWRMPERNVVSWTVMLGGLIEDGRVDDSRQLFDMMPVKDVVASTNMTDGLCSEGRMIETS